MTEPADEINDDVFQYDGPMSQCISGFGANTIELIRTEIRETFRQSLRVEAMERIEWHVGELVRWCRAFNGELQKAAREAANESATVFKTERFAVSHVHCERNDERWFAGRDVYIAFHHDADVPSPVCIVTLFGNWVEWVEVPACERRNKIATEVLTGLEKHVGSLELSGVTEEGEAFVNAFCPEEES